MSIITRGQYEALVDKLDIPFSSCLDHRHIARRFPGVPIHAITSLIQRHDVDKEKKHAINHIRRARNYAERYLEGEDILDLSHECDFSPCWILRLVISVVLGIPHEDAQKLLRTPYEILTWRGLDSRLDPGADCLRRLVGDVHRCALADRCNSPYVSIAQRMAGVLHERKLEELLHRAGVPFFNEDDMRKVGCEKTPDALLQGLEPKLIVPAPYAILHASLPLLQSQSLKFIPDCKGNLRRMVGQLVTALQHATHGMVSAYDAMGQPALSGCGCKALLQSVPILLQGSLVSWIDSKAMFGDDVTHNENARKQYSTYVNRFGPGAVIYWFGFIEDLSEASSDVLLITTFEPSGVRQIDGY